jgi:hypothetical protein
VAGKRATGGRRRRTAGEEGAAARRELEKAGNFPYDFDMHDFLGAFRDPDEGGKLFEMLEAHGLEPLSSGF